MFNDWLTIGPLTIHGYGAMIAVGILVGIYIAEKLAKRFGLNYEKIDSFILYTIVFGYACSKLTYVIVSWDQFLKDPMSVLGSGGWVVYGGILGGVFGAWLWCRYFKWDFMKYFNTVIPVVALAQGFGRIGCFFAGCCAGVPTHAWYGIQFPAGSLAWNTTDKLVPVQLISAAGDFLIFAYLYYQLTKSKHPDDTAAWYLILYSLGRFAVEFLRGDLIRGSVGALSTSQFISLFTFLGGCLLIYIRSRNDKKIKEEIVE